MHIALSTPVSLDLFAPYVDHTEVLPQGFSYPFAFYLTLELLEQGHRVTVVTSAYDVKLHSVWQGMEGRLTVIAIPRRHPREYCLDVYRREVSSMCAELKKAAPDIIHAQWTYEFADAALSTGIPCVVTARDAPWLVAWHFKRFYRLYRAVYSSIWQIPRIRHLTCVSPHILEILQKEPLLKAKTLVVIPNGLDRRFFAAGPRYEVHNSTSPRFVSVTGWSSLKNVPCLLRAFSIVKRVYPSATLILIGDGVGTGGAAEKWAKKRR
jgi:glycosyltransferase involved in cell wall biosynthesis